MNIDNDLFQIAREAFRSANGREPGSADELQAWSDEHLPSFKRLVEKLLLGRLAHGN